MFSVFRNAWKIEDLRKKILFTALIILLFRLGSAIPVPFLDADALTNLFSNFKAENNIFSFLNTMAGGALEKATFFALSISPYINASIIMQLLAVAIPAIERRMQEDPEYGRKWMEKWTRYLSIILSLILGFGYYTVLKNQAGYQIVDSSVGVFGAIVITLCFAAGSMVVMWMGELINDRGIGNGISMILFAGIISRGPALIGIAKALVTSGAAGWISLIAIIIGVLALTVFVVFMTDGERRIPVQYAKKVVGRKMYGGQNTNIPLKVNMTGVMPIIFAQSFVLLPSTIANFFPSINKGWFAHVITALNPGGWVYTLVMFLLIIGFSYFYTVITFNPIEVASNLKKNGGFIMGIRPGKPTSDYITKTLNRVTFVGALFLGVVSAAPSLVAMFKPSMSGLAIGGTTLLIIVGVALETVKQLESQMLMRHYKGFLE